MTEAERVIRVELPAHLRTLANTGAEVELLIAGPVTTRAVLDALEERFLALRGTVRDYAAPQARRPYLRFFACGLDLSHEPMDSPLPETVASGKEPFLIVGAMAGG